MAQKNSFIQKQIKRLTLSISHYHGRRDIYAEYKSIGKENLQAKAKMKIDKKSIKLARKYAKINYYVVNPEEIFNTDADARIAQKAAKFHLAYRAKREATKRAISKDRSETALFEMRLYAYKEELDAKLEAYKAKLAKEKEIFLAKMQAKVKHKDYKALLSCQETKHQEILEAFRQKVETQTANAISRFEKRIDCRVEKSDAKLEKVKNALAKIKALSYQDELAEDVVLKTRGLSMYFGGLKAVDDLNIEVKKGDVFGLIGPNGAGKTTVFNCITKFYTPTKGDVFYRNNIGKVVRLNDEVVHDVITQGIARTFQNVEVVQEVSILDNLLIAGTRQYTTGLFAHALHLPILKIEEKVMKARAEKVLKYLDLLPYQHMLAFGQPYGILKKIEIARTLMTNPSLIILDEPAAGLNDTETAELAKLIIDIRDNFDVTILLVEHDMGLVMEICNQICVLSFGRKLAEGTPSEIQQNKLVQEAYLGVED